MSEAKEKAKELFDKFSFNCRECDNAKLSALISIEFAREFITGDLSEKFDKTMYLLEVKEEIEKL